jgi:fructose-1,6-bisphosphatase/inositol monophosphatase family enzyme
MPSSSIPKPQAIVAKLRELQRQIRQAVIDGHKQVDRASVKRASTADTIYGIDAAIEPVLEVFLEQWGQTLPMVVIAEGLEPETGRTFPTGTSERDAIVRLIIDPIDGTRGIMYDKRPAWSLVGVAPNRGAITRLRDVEVAVMTELPTSKMGFADVLWAIKGQGAHGVRERLHEPEVIMEDLRGRPLGRVLTKMGKVAREHVVEALTEQQTSRAPIGQILLGRGRVTESDIQIALAFQKGEEPELGGELLAAYAGDALALQPSQADTIAHGFAMVSNFFPGTKVLSAGLMEFLAQNLIGPADVTKASVFEDQYISTGGQFYELMIGHDRFNADLRPAFYRMQRQGEGLCCHPYDCATMLIAEEAGVILTNETGQPLDGPLDTTTGLSWVGYANSNLREKIEPLLLHFLQNYPPAK